MSRDFSKKAAGRNSVFVSNERSKEISVGFLSSENVLEPSKAHFPKMDHFRDVFETCQNIDASSSEIFNDRLKKFCGDDGFDESGVFRKLFFFGQAPADMF